MLPNVLAVVMNYLRTELAPAGGVWADLPEDPGFPLIKVERVGGGLVNTGQFAHLDEALLQVDVYSEDRAGCAELGNRVREVMAELPYKIQAPAVSRVDSGTHRHLTRSDMAPYTHRTQTDFTVWIHG